MYKFFKEVLNLLARLFQNTSVPDIKTVEYIPLTKESVELLKEQLETMQPPMETIQEKFIKVCLDALDTDPSTPDSVKDELGCADSVSHLIKKILPDFPVLVSTKDLDMKLYLDKRFERITEPEKGSIIISPRTNTTFGHTGVFITSERIASNDSKSGLFQGNYDFNSWINAFKVKKGLRIYLYRLKA